MRDIESLILLCGLFVIAWNDSMERRIPNRILLILLIVRMVLFIWKCALHRGNWITEWNLSMEGVLFGGGICLLIYLLFFGSFGAGDVKLFAIVGCYLGSEDILLTVFLSVFYAALYSVGMLMRKKADLKRKIPFSPFVFLGVITVMILQ